MRSSPSPRGRCGRGVYLRVSYPRPKAGKDLTPDDLLVSSEKKLHFFIYDPGLTGLQHLHPDFQDNVWNIGITETQNANYWVWVQGELTDQTEFSASARLVVQGGTPAAPDHPTLVEARTGADGNSVVTVSNDPIHAGEMAMLGIDFTRADGSAPAITPWLGEMGHAIVVSADGATFYHEHVMADSMGMLMLHLMIEQPGLYRVWIQFQDAGVLKTAPLALPVL